VTQNQQIVDLRKSMVDAFSQCHFERVNNIIATGSNNQIAIMLDTLNA